MSEEERQLARTLLAQYQKMCQMRVTYTLPAMLHMRLGVDKHSLGEAARREIATEFGRRLLDTGVVTSGQSDNRDGVIFSAVAWCVNPTVMADIVLHAYRAGLAAREVAL